MRRNALKRLFAGLLALVMVMTFLPATAFADDDLPTEEQAPEGQIELAGDPTEGNEPGELEGQIVLMDDPADPEESEDPDEPTDEDGPEINSYEEFMSNLAVLEYYANAYAEANGEDANELVINYIRTGVARYQGSLWEGMAGKEKTEFVAYVAEQDEANGSTVAALRRLNKFNLPNGDLVEFGHMFGVLNIAYYSRNLAAESAQSSADFGGWLGDLCDLLTKTTEIDCTDMEAAATEIRTNYLGVFHGENSFDMLDVMADLDAFYLFQQVKNGGSLSAAMEGFYTDSLSMADRASFFKENRFPTLNTVWGVRNTVKKLYTSSLLVSALEAQRDIAQYTDQKTACCYAWADYICDLAGVTEMGNENDGIEQPDEPQPEDPEVDLPSNGFYSVFSSTTSTLAPGVTQTIKYANTADDKQFVYYIATVDVNRDDLTVCANYNNNDGSQLGLQSVRDQMAAAQAKHADQENYNVILGVNADFFNMNTGETNGLVMEGVEYKPMGNHNFFAILKDGTPMIGGPSDYVTYRDQIQEAVAGSIMLVRDGKSVINTSSNYYKNRAPRTCVGITEDGKVVLMVLDGRQEPFSCGGSAEEIAQVMVEAGCVIAMNLDGGGSSTFVAKQEGEDVPVVVNRPSDGYDRKVASSLMVVSGAVVSNEFDHAALIPESEYAAPGAKVSIKANGVSASGNAAELPEDLVWSVDDESIGSIGEDGVFYAFAPGNARVSLQSGGHEIGVTVIHVVMPDGLYFSDNEVAAVYGSTVPMPIVATYNDNRVKIPSEGDLIQFTLGNADAGSFSGIAFTAADEDCGVRSTAVTATIQGVEGISAEAMIYLYKNGEATFDFNNPTAGDRTLAWNREVSNSTFDGEDVVYYIDDPDLEMIISYVFALDMSSLGFPENIAQALPVVAQFLGGAVGEDTTAWQMLLMLAERVSPSTTVTVTVNIDTDLELDYSEMMVNCDYFTLTSTEYDPETGKMTLICNWNKVDGPIDENTANPLCIVSGIKAKAKEDAPWDAQDRLYITNTGSIEYNARVRSSQAYTISQNPNVQEYGIFPYDNSANLENDKGAQFSSTHATFEDSFILDKTDLEGWVKTEDSSYFYYVHNKKITGIQCVPDQKGTEAEYYYNFGEDGVCRGKFTGLLEQGEDLYFIINGEPRPGWRVLGDDYYYFDPDTGKAVDGKQKIDNYNYEFEDKKLVDGQWVGKRKMWAGAYLTAQWKEIKGKTYYFDNYGFAEIGCFAIPLGSTTDEYGLYVFGEDRALVERVMGDGFYSYGDKLFYLENDKVGYSGLIVEYYDFDGNKTDNKDIAEKAVYYYITSRTFEAVKGKSYYCTKTNDLLPKGTYPFDENGQYTVILRTEPVDPEEPVTVKNGIVEEDGELYFYENDKKIYAGLVVEYFDEDGNKVDSKDDAFKAVYYYFTSRTFEAVRSKNYYMTKTNDLRAKGYWEFDENCQHIEILRAPSQPDPEFKNGIVEEDGELYFYENNKKVYAGLVVEYYDEDGNKVESTDNPYKAVYYYFTSRTFEAVRSKNYYMTKTNDLRAKGYWQFDENCQHIEILREPTQPDPTIKNGIVEEDGKLYFYENDQKVYKGLYVEYFDADGNKLESKDGAYKAVYYYFTSRTFEAVCGKSYYMTKTNDLVPRQTWEFDENCQHIVIL